MEDTGGKNFLTIRFDKNHLISIGQKLYTQSLDLVRELVANAYDADATVVKISTVDNQLIVEDNGSGMNRGGLEQYFTIGSTFKKDNPQTNKFKRIRIGEFGIGKFAVLALCDRFELYTKSSVYSATVIFNQIDFEKSEKWQVPIIEHVKNSLDSTTATRVVLYNLKKTLSEFDLERYLINIFPLHDKNFSIYLNEKKLLPHYIPGERFNINELCEFGKIKGEAILASMLLNKEQIGIGIRVKGVLIKRDTFGLENTHKVSTGRLTGEVYADFLPITTDRSSFIIDSKEYQFFHLTMQKQLRKVVRQLEKSAASYQDKKAERVLSDVLGLIRQALRQNQEIFISADLPLFTKQKSKILPEELKNGVISTNLKLKTKIRKNTNDDSDQTLKQALRQAVKLLKPKMRRRVKTLLRDERRIVKSVKIGGSEFLVSFAHLGIEEKESFVEGGIIFINRDHGLFKKLENKTDLIYYHLTRLVSQELIKFTVPKNLELAFDWQGKLIKDAFLEYKTTK